MTMSWHMMVQPHAGGAENPEAGSSTQHAPQKWFGGKVLNKAGNYGRRSDTSGAALWSGEIGPLEAECFAHLTN